MPPPVALRREEPRKPHPRSLVPYEQVFNASTCDNPALLRASSSRQFVPPLAHRRNNAKSPLEVRVRANVISVLGINLVEQTFKTHFFVECTWVRQRLLGGCGRTATLAAPTRVCAWPPRRLPATRFRAGRTAV